jgi:GNAT superfamily N-acetyltransferase
MNKKFFWEPDDIVFDDDDVALAYKYTQRTLPGFKENLHPRYRGKFINKPAKASKVEVDNDDIEAANALIEKDLTRDDFAHLVGAQKGTTVEIHTYSDSVGVDTTSDEYYNERTVYSDHIHNDLMRVQKEHQGKGIGTKVLYEEVMTAKDLGFDYIDTQAARNDTMNGYYTWPRLGYDAEIDDLSQGSYGDLQKIKDYADKNGFTNVRDFMQTKEDRQYWKDYGVGFDAKFDLHNEQSLGALQAAYDAVKNK